MSQDSPSYQFQVPRPAERLLARLGEGTAAAILQFMLGALIDNPHRVGAPLQRELDGLHSARRGAYRIVYEVLDKDRVVVVHRIDHRSTVYRSR